MCVGGGNPCEVEKHQLKHLAARARAEKWAIDGAELVVGGRLGEGSHGVVLRGEWRGLAVSCKVWQRVDRVMEGGASI